MTVVHRNSTIMFKNDKLSNGNCIWQHQKYARPETYVAIIVEEPIDYCGLRTILFHDSCCQQVSKGRQSTAAQGFEPRISVCETNALPLAAQQITILTLTLKLTKAK